MIKEKVDQFTELKSIIKVINLIRNRFCFSPYFFVAGGAVTDCLLGKAAKDIDIFTKKSRDYDRLLKGVGTEKELRKSSMGTLVRVPYSSVPLHIVYPSDEVPKTMKKAVEQFDFTVCAIATDGKYIMKHDDFHKHLADRILRFNNFNSTDLLTRVVRYIQKGFKLTDEDTIKRLVDFCDTRLNETGYASGYSFDPGAETRGLLLSSSELTALRDRVQNGELLEKVLMSRSF